MRPGLCLLLAAFAAQAAEKWTFWIEPCTAKLSRESGCQAGDAQLAGWAVQAWQRASAGALDVQRTSRENQARLRIYWAPGNLRVYGETRPLKVNGRPGAAIVVRPDLADLGPDIDAAGSADPLFRESVVYLTCLHESGHAFGLRHTGNFEDIMYSFTFGGDLVEYFRRYRRLLASRRDIREHSGISESDRRMLRNLLHR